MLHRMKINTIILGLLLCCLAGCTGPMVAQDDNLYSALGGRQGIDNIIGRFIYLLGDEPKVNKHFEKTDLDRFYAKFTEQICQISGGPCEYTGDTMSQSHDGMNITETEFNLLVELLIDAMEGEQIPHPAQNRLLRLLAPMREDILYR